MILLKDCFYVNLFQSKRLVTHEDGRYYHLHKILGILSLAHFIYRLFMYTKIGKLGFEESDSWMLFWILVHSSLHVSSFEFLLSRRRNRVYNIIWPEMRWHSLLFAYRSLLVMLITWLYESGMVGYHIMYLRGLIVIGTMLCADYVTKYFEADSTTMRGNPYPHYVPIWFIHAHNTFYSMSQIFATMNMLFKGKNLAFLSLIPIQTAPFCMTLIKKGIITQAAWHMYYTIAIGINYYYALYDQSNIEWFKYLGMMLIFCRFVLRINKYVLWGAVVLFQAYLLKYETFEYLEKLKTT